MQKTKSKPNIQVDLLNRHSHHNQQINTHHANSSAEILEQLKALNDKITILEEKLKNNNQAIQKLSHDKGKQLSTDVVLFQKDIEANRTNCATFINTHLRDIKIEESDILDVKDYRLRRAP